MTLERTETKKEQAIQPTSEKEQVKEPTSTEKKSTSETAPVEETYTKVQLEDMIKQAVIKGKGEVQAAKDKEVREFKTKLQELESQMEGSKLRAVEEHELQTWGDTDEVKQFQTTRRQFAEERKAFFGERQALEQIKLDLDTKAKASEAKRFASEYGVDEKILLEAKTPEEMESKAVKLAFEKVKGERDELKKTPQVVDSGVSTGLGENWRDLPPGDKIKSALSKKK